MNLKSDMILLFLFPEVAWLHIYLFTKRISTSRIFWFKFRSTI